MIQYKPKWIKPGYMLCIFFFCTGLPVTRTPQQPLLKHSMTAGQAAFHHKLTSTRSSICLSTCISTMAVALVQAILTRTGR